MAGPEKTTSSGNCQQCGAALPGEWGAELCPKCLLKAGLDTQPGRGPNGTVALPRPETRSRALPQPGEQLGHYRIIRTLGQGGMGAVFDAEDLESGRRVALKVLSHTLDLPEARERFFREGRLAASINHPNSVYVFGTEEIGGTPVITMEMIAGGTLQERVCGQGPLPVGEAVEYMLQIIAGLEAAQRVGILHRDIKPSNCFLDAGGGVKIGDFGLSISTTVRLEPALTVTGTFLGTPAFSSPEQLRGDELNVRSDMYSVGATLFYLLTGRTPFEAKNVVQLLATVLEQRAPSPRKFRPNIPPGLAKVILRCLEKQPSERFKNYADLAEALAPYSSAAPTPATLGLRFLAGVLDVLVLNGLFISLLLVSGGSPMDFLNLASQISPKALALIIAAFAGTLLYYGWCEGLWGAAAGKALCRLRVVGPNKSAPGFLRALLRAAFYVGVPLLPYWLVYGGNPQGYLKSPPAIQYLVGVCFYLVLALLFCTARRRNGFAAAHDLLTRTRVISRAAYQTRPVFAASEVPPPTVEGAPLVGPYHVLEILERFAGGEWLLGYDLRLLRKVWLRTVPPGTPAVPATLRNVGRVGRLRWLAGRRSPEQNWDAFEAASGKPFLSLAQTPQPWSQVRFWLFDLATELRAAEKDGTLPALLAPDRVWITGDGRAKLLDFPAPGLALESPVRSTGFTKADPPGVETPGLGPPSSEKGRIQHFLSEVAAVALSGRVDADAKAAGEVAVPLPLHARAFLKGLPQYLDADAILIGLKPLLARVAEVSRLRRAAVVAGCLAFPMLASLVMTLGMNWMQQWSRSNPGTEELSRLLGVRSGMHLFGRKPSTPTDRQFAIYIASHYRSVITNQTSWSSAFALALVRGEARRFAEQSVADHPAPTGKEIEEADAAVEPILPKPEMFNVTKQAWFPLVVFAGTLAGYAGLPALVAALLFRGGLVLLIAGVVFVRKDGARASRLRMLWRGLVAWGSPGLAMLVTWILLCAVYSLKPTLDRQLGAFAWALTSGLMICALTIVSIALPKRGLPDRLAGTWPVPR